MPSEIEIEKLTRKLIDQARVRWGLQTEAELDQLTISELHCCIQPILKRAQRRMATQKQLVEDFKACDLAREFCVVLNEWLPPEKIAEINRRNREEYVGTGNCASHDFCDPNQAMIDAWDKLFPEMDIFHDIGDHLTSAAWEIASDIAGFDPDKIPRNDGQNNRGLRDVGKGSRTVPPAGA